MPKIAETKITTNDVTKVPAAILMFLELRLGDELEWFIDKSNRVVVAKKV
jgi:hypothetical protein